MTASPQRTARVALAVMLSSVCWLDYGNYRDTFHTTPDAWTDVLHGTANAPEQYRVGVVRAAYWIAQHTPLHAQHAFAVMDTICALVAGFLLLRVLERTSVFRRSTATMQCFGYATFLALVTFYLLWLTKPQKPETLPTVLLAAVMLCLWQPWSEDPDTGYPSFVRAHSLLWRNWVPALGLIGVTFLLALLRADVGLAIGLGFLIVALSALGKKLSLPRAPSALTSIALVLITAGIQLYLMKVAYPQATYGRVKMWQLRPNIVHATRWPPFVLFMLPVAWTLAKSLRRRFTEDASSVAMLLGAVLYAVLWVTIGKIDEVRIFLPFALALAPLTVEMLLLSFSLAPQLPNG